MARMSWKRLSHLSRKEIEQFQNKELREFVRHRIPFSPFYRRLFAEKNLGFDDIKTTADLVKLPFTTKEDIAPTKKEPKRPINFVLQPNADLLRQYSSKRYLALLALQKACGMNVKARLEQLFKPIHIHFTTGRTALPTPFLYSASDIERLKEAGNRMLDCFGISRDEIAINAFPYAPHLAFWQAFYALNSNGLLSLQTGGGKILGTEKIAKAIESMKANVLIAMPGYAYHLLKTAMEEKIRLSSLRHIIFGGERVPEGLRRNIKDLLRIPRLKIMSTYALTEGKVAWPQCCEQSGYHLYPDMEFVEIVDKRGERVGEGERGEIVYTSLGWHGSVVLRYKTGDISSLELERCQFCGRTVPRISTAIERSSEFKEFRLTKIKGMLINLNAFFPLLSARRDIEEWQVELRKRRNDPYEIDELYVYIAPKKGINVEKLKAELQHEIKNETDVSPTAIIKMSKAELLSRLGMETELKEKRIVDKRPKPRTRS